MNFKRTILLALIFFCSNSFAQQLAQKLTRLKFLTLTGGTIILQAQLDEYNDTLNFILDTGSGGISLDSVTAESFGLKPAATTKFVKGIGGVKPLQYLYNHRLKINNLIVDSLDFHLNNYNLLSGIYGLKIDGIIGQSFFKKYIVRVDYDYNELTIYHSGILKYPRRGMVVNIGKYVLPTIETLLKNNTDKNVDLIFDTGAGLSLLLQDKASADSNIIAASKKKFNVQAEGLGGRQVMQLTIVEQVRVGKYKFKRIPTYVFNDEYNVVGYPKNIGVLGNDVLRRFNLIINYPNNEIHLKPNGHFYDDFDYAYTGLTMYKTEEDIIIDDVIKDSPADKAGIKSGDVVFAINNNFSKNIQTYKTLLQSPGNTVSVLLIRNGEPVAKQLKVVNLLDD